MSLETKANTPQPTQTQPRPKTSKSFVLVLVAALILFLSQIFLGLILASMVFYVSFQVMVAGYNDNRSVVPQGIPQIERRITIPVSDVIIEAVWSGDGEKIIINTFSEILIVDSETGAHLTSFNPQLITFSPSRNVLIFKITENSKSYYHFYDLVTMREVAVIPGFLGFSYTPLDRSWSPDERLTFVFDNFTNTQVNIWNFETQALVKTIGPATGASWSPTHELLVTTFDNEVTIWNTTDWAIEKRLGFDYQVRDAVWSPDSTKLIVMLDDNNSSGFQKTLSIWDVAAETEVMQISFISPGFTMTPDNAYMLGIVNFSSVMVWDANTGTVVHQLDHHLIRINNPAGRWSPNGSYLLHTQNNSQHAIVNTVTGEEVIQFSGYIIEWSPDGKRLATTTYNPIARRVDIHIYDTSTWELVAVLNNPEVYIYSIIWSPDSQQIMAVHTLGNDSVHIWEVP